jgi:hypothetical protein
MKLCLPKQAHEVCGPKYLALLLKDVYGGDLGLDECHWKKRMLEVVN